jgi:myosin heavy subunit
VETRFVFHLSPDTYLIVFGPAMQIQYNITRIEEWCKSHDMPEGTLQLEHLMQATKLLQLKKVRRSVFDAIYFIKLDDLPGHSCRYRNNLRRLLDAQSYADPAHVHQLLRRRLRGELSQSSLNNS